MRRALRDLRDATVPARHRAGRPRAGSRTSAAAADVDVLDPDDHDGRAAVARPADDERAALAALVRMGRDYLRLDPVGGGRHVRRLARRHRPVRGRRRAGRDAVDVATFHAAKGLEWADRAPRRRSRTATCPIAHARTAAAKAEEARLLYVAMTRAQRELRITWAEQRTFAGRVVDRRRSPLLAPLPDAARRVAEPAGHADPARRRLGRGAGPPAGASSTRSRRPVDPELDGAAAWRDTAARAARSSPRPCCPTTCSPASSPTRPGRPRRARRHPRRGHDPRRALRPRPARRARGRRRQDVGR